MTWVILSVIRASHDLQTFLCNYCDVTTILIFCESIPKNLQTNIMTYKLCIVSFVGYGMELPYMYGSFMDMVTR